MIESLCQVDLGHLRRHAIHIHFHTHIIRERHVGSRSNDRVLELCRCRFCHSHGWTDRVQLDRCIASPTLLPPCHSNRTPVCVVCVVGESILGHGRTDQLLRGSTFVSRRPELLV